jgi:chlorite dismutase
VYGGQPHGEDVFALVLYSEADPASFFEEVDGLRANFDHYDTHVKTAVYEPQSDGLAAVVSIWETESAADTAAGFLADLPGIVARADQSEAIAPTPGSDGSASDAESGHATDDEVGHTTDAEAGHTTDAAGGWGTMGMFYTVKPDYREEFVETFGDVGGLLAEMDGHRETALLANREDENDMFIASQWAAKEDAMAFFQSEAFRDTVEWGREVLDDRPRHVFLA